MWWGYYKTNLIKLVLTFLVFFMFFTSFTQLVNSEQEKNIELKYFYSETCEACIEKGHIITEIQENYSEQIIVLYYNYSENQEFFDEYGISSTPSAVVTNKTNGLYTLINYERFDRETIESIILLHLQGNYTNYTQQHDSFDSQESFSLKIPIMIIVALIDIFIIIVLFLRRDILPKKNLIVILTLAIVSLIILAVVNIPYTHDTKNSTTITSLEISKDDKLSMLDYSYNVLQNYFKNNTQKPGTLQDDPLDYKYNKLYITMYQNDTIIGCNSGSIDTDKDNRVYLDIYEATIKCIHDQKYQGVILEEQIPFIDIVISFLYNKTDVKIGPLGYNVELGINAVEMEKEAYGDLYLESIPILSNYNLDQILRNFCLENNLDSNCYKDKSAQLYKYDTVTFKKDSKGDLLDLYRYNVLIDTEDVTSQEIYESLSNAYNWFLNNINQGSGLLQYEYYPSLDNYSSEDSHLRRMAAMWALTTLKDFLGIDSSLYLINTTLDYYLNFKQSTCNYSYIDIYGDSKIANNAFLILTLINTPDYPQKDQLLTELAEGIIAMQNEDGSFNTYFTFNTTSGIDYYPGECLLSLMMLYKDTWNISYLESVEKAFTYYKEYWLNNKNTAFIPWHTQAYKLLYEETKDSDVASFIFEMNNWILDYQIQDSTYPDEIGGFSKDYPTTATSSYIEGINDAYIVAKYLNDTYHTEKYFNSIKKATRFILQTQFTNENSFYLINQTRAIGGFKYSLIDNRIRNDFVQHSVCTLIKTYENNIFT
jgi:thiol-disulfide isomerase/thioredoxin/AMMECR1 domain-containing protein